VLWEIVQKTISYLFIIAILYISSQTLLQWSDIRRIENIKIEIQRDFKEREKDMDKQLYFIEAKVNDYIITETRRLDTMQERLDQVTTCKLPEKQDK